MNQTRKSYEKSCKKIGGPKNPEKSQCEESSKAESNCDSFREGYCRFKVDIHDRLIASVKRGKTLYK